jgi:hypothetical protein
MSQKINSRVTIHCQIQIHQDHMDQKGEYMTVCIRQQFKLKYIKNQVLVVYCKELCHH